MQISVRITGSKIIGTEVSVCPFHLLERKEKEKEKKRKGES